MARRILSEILQPRAEEIFHLVWDEIRRAGYEKSLNSGIVLTGGGAILEGMPEIAEQIFDLPIRRGAPTGIGGLADHVGSPAFATPSGLVLYGQRQSDGGSDAHDRRRRVRPSGGPAQGACSGSSSDSVEDAEDTHVTGLRTSDPDLQGHRPVASCGCGSTRIAAPAPASRSWASAAAAATPSRAWCRAASRASSSSSPTPTCRRCRSTRRR